MILSFLIPGCRSVAVQEPSENLAVWENDMTYQYLDGDEKEGREVIRFAKKYSDYKNYYPRYKIGNLAIVEGSSPPPSMTMDASGRRAMIGVIMGENPRFVQFPDRNLFRHFMEIVRNNPDAIKNSVYKEPVKQKQYSVDVRNRIALLLSSGSSDYMKSDEFENAVVKAQFEEIQVKPQELSWVDENGTLTIRFFRTKTVGYQAPLPIQCTLVVDENQDFTFDCEDLF